MTASRTISIAVHGGAGAVPRHSISPNEERSYHEALERALGAGHAVLAEGGNSLDAVVAAVVVLEDCPLFNAGCGGVLTYDGQVLTDAAVMSGETRDYGAVTNVSGVRNPVLLARSVLASPHVLLSGRGAEEFARSAGLAFEPSDYFITPARLREWQMARSGSLAATVEPPGVGTVGAVARDRGGNVAAATSTGGMLMKRWGRVGDSPIAGAGTYADNRGAAVSATGHGEMFLRAVAAHDVCARVRYLGQDLNTASREVLREVSDLGGNGGLIAVDPHGHIAMEFNSDGMYRGCIDVSGHLQTHIWT